MVGNPCKAVAFHWLIWLLADLVGVDAVFGGDLGQCFVFAQHLLDDLRLEGSGVSFSCCHFSCCHRMSLNRHTLF
jgi:hypothetical protein